MMQAYSINDYDFTNKEIALSLLFLHHIIRAYKITFQFSFVKVIMNVRICFGLSVTERLASIVFNDF